MQPNLLGALLDDVQTINEQMRAALSGQPTLPSAVLSALLRRQGRRRRRQTRDLRAIREIQFTHRSDGDDRSIKG